MDGSYLDNVGRRQQEAVLAILIMLRQLKGVAVVNVLGDVPVVCGSPRQSPGPKHLPRSPRSVVLPVLGLHRLADVPGQAGQLALGGVGLGLVAPGVDEDTAVGVDGDRGLDIGQALDIVPQGDGLQLREGVGALVHLAAGVAAGPHAVALGEVPVEVDSDAAGARDADQ